MKLNISTIIATALLASAGIEAKLSSDQRDDLLELHKKARHALDSPDMKSITWDESLASAAQAYSAQCKGMVHSGVGGENLAGSTTGDVTRMFNNWMKEKSLFDKSGYRSSLKDVHYENEDIGHYSQIVWAKNTKVGCGLTYCENYSAKYLLVCRYGTGNVLNQQVYSLGSGQKDDSDKKKSDDHQKEKTTTTTTQKTTTTTTQKTTTTTTVESKATPEPKPTTTQDQNESSRAVPTSEAEKQKQPTVNSSVVPGNSTATNDDNKKVETKDGQTVKPDGTVETKNINENYEKDGIIDEVGPSTSTSGFIGSHNNAANLIYFCLLVNFVYFVLNF